MSANKQPLVTIPHPRCIWRGDEVVHICTRWGRLKGTDESARFRKKVKADYELAKHHGDFDAASRLVKGFLDRSEATIDAIIDSVSPFLRERTPLVCVVPHPAFDDEDGGFDDVASRPSPRNAIPSTYAAFLAETIGAEVDSDILERERVGRTKLKSFERFLWQPSFTGAVRSEVAYVLVDDVFTLGGTLAALRSYILRSGGTVAAMTALAHRTGKQQCLALTQKTWDDLLALFGADVDRFWTEEVGHGANCLTEAEGKVLVDWARTESERQPGLPLLQCLRNRLVETSASTREQVGS